MIKVLTVFASLVFFTSCSRFESKKYINEENKAIIDIIPILLNENNDHFSLEGSVIYLVNELYNEIDSNYAEISESDIKSLTPFFKKEISQRSLNVNLDSIYDFKIIYLSKNKIEKNHNYYIKEENAKGFLCISRIIFNKKYNLGYVDFGFYCGEACLWVSTIEIKKINNKWIKTRELRGVIS